MKKYLDFIKENFTLIVSIPPFLGAIWQLIKLSQISFSYIRFFSVTQLIADGTIIIISLFLISLSSIILNSIFDNKRKHKTDDNVNSDIESDFIFKITTPIKPNFYWGLVYLFINTFFICLFLLLNQHLADNLDLFIIIWVAIPINLIFYIIIGLITLLCSNHFKSLDVKYKEKIRVYFSLLIILISISIFLQYWETFNKIMLFPDNLINQSKIEKAINKEYPNKKINLEYNNDKYLFYSITDTINKIEKIKIVPFEKLFEE